MWMTLIKEDHRLVVEREADGEKREVLVGEDALRVALAFGFQDDPEQPENEVWARALGYLDSRVGARISTGGDLLGFADEATVGRQIDAAVERLQELRGALSELDAAAPVLGHYLQEETTLNGFDAAHEELRIEVSDAEAEVERLRERVGSILGRK